MAGVGLGGIVALSLVLLVATFGIGLLPLYWANGHRNQDKFVALLSHFGVGMLLGTSFMLVIPEGISECLEHDGNVGLNLLVGFLVVYVLDRFTHVMMHGRAGSNPGAIPQEEAIEPLDSLQDVLLRPKTVCRNILRNNVVFALFIHGLSDGVALGTAIHNESLLVVMLIAIVIHKIPAVLSLTSLMISKQQLPQWEVVSNLFAFAASTPIGYVVLSLFNLKNSETMGWLSGNLLLMSGGSLLYAALTAFVDEDSHSHVAEDLHGTASINFDDLEGLENARSYRIVKNQSQEFLHDSLQGHHNNDDSTANSTSMEPSTATADNSSHHEQSSTLKYDKSVYVLCGVILPVLISYVIKE